ncbi:hypothetical protein [Streptomyces puniciscabiei]|uniref:hypothetical protein n=1 Tax=Streptomyces puniciscabiei TaxID=164348 RepID=UPI00331E0E76
MARLRGGAVTAAVVLTAVAGCTDRTKGASGPERSGGDGAVLAAVGSLTVKGRAPKAGYSRARFGTAWSDTDANSCDTRVISVLRGVIAGLSQLIRGVVRCAY